LFLLLVDFGRMPLWAGAEPYPGLILPHPYPVESYRNSALNKRSLSASSKPGKTTILTNSIDDEDENMDPDLKHSLDIAMDSVTNTTEPKPNTNSTASNDTTAADPPLITVIPDSEIAAKNGAPPAKTGEVEPEPLPADTNIISDLINQPQIFLDVLTLKWER
jgi:hypothetical protein